MKTYATPIASLFLTVCVFGCSQDTSPSANGGSDQVASDADASIYLLATAPEKPVEVIEARASAKDGEEITVVGRIGGSKTPWINDRAAFSIVDRSLKPCSDLPGDNCPTPWDYCCQTDKLPKGTALIKVVDAQGQLVKTSAKNIPGVKELAIVVVKGTAQRDEAGNLTVVARGVYVQEGA